MQNQKTDEKLKVEVSLAEWRLIEYIRKLKWGSLEITVQNSIPVVVKAAYQTTKLA